MLMNVEVDFTREEEGLYEKHLIVFWIMKQIQLIEGNLNMLQIV